MFDRKWDPPEHPYLLSYDDLEQLGIRYSKEHLRRLEADELFPRRVRLTANRVTWLKDEVEAWISEKTEARA